MQIDISLPFNEFKDSGGSSDQFRRYHLFPSGAYKEQVPVFMQELLEVTEATAKASGVSDGVNGPFWEILNINFLKMHD